MDDQTKNCPICDEGHLRHQLGKNNVDYKGNTTELVMHYSVCDACGSEQADASQTRDNKRAMLAFRKHVDGLLSGGEVRSLRMKWGLSQAEAARIFGGGPVAFSKYESDDVSQSEAMDKLLRLVAVMPSALHYLKRQAGLEEVEAADWTKTASALPRAAHPRSKIVTSSSPEPVQDWRKCA